MRTHFDDGSGKLHGDSLHFHQLTAGAILFTLIHIM